MFSPHLVFELLRKIAIEKLIFIFGYFNFLINFLRNIMKSSGWVINIDVIIV